MNSKFTLEFYLIVSCILSFTKDVRVKGESNLEEGPLKCDACKIISQRFSSSFKSAEIEAGRRRLTEDEYIEAAESTCDEEWSGYGVLKSDGVSKLVRKDDLMEPKGQFEQDHMWGRRLQDFCDELLSETPDEKTLYNTWSSDVSALEKYLCNGEGMFQACVPGVEFGPWPGDDYDDYDDFDYVHDEF